ncbi:MAG: thioredoxin domain-containing protein [Pseudomonadota bacterium]
MKNVIAIGAVVLALAAGGAWWFSSQSTATESTQIAQASTGTGAETSDNTEVDTSSVLEMTLGAEDAPVTLVEYASFTCPHCASFHANQFKQLKTEFIDTGKVRFIHRDVYFDRFGLWASMVARCAGPDRFFGISDMIYDQQSDWLASRDPVQIADELRKIGKVAGLSEDQLEACLSDSDKAEAMVALYQQNAEADDVTSTPTLVINGTKHQNMAYPELKDIINGLIN